VSLLPHDFPCSPSLVTVPYGKESNRGSIAMQPTAWHTEEDGCPKVSFGLFVASYRYITVTTLWLICAIDCSQQEGEVRLDFSGHRNSDYGISTVDTLTLQAKFFPGWLCLSWLCQCLRLPVVRPSSYLPSLFVDLTFSIARGPLSLKSISTLSRCRQRYC
jgi:hypothetical protein